MKHEFVTHIGCGHPLDAGTFNLLHAVVELAHKDARGRVTAASYQDKESIRREAQEFLAEVTADPGLLWV